MRASFHATSIACACLLGSLGLGACASAPPPELNDAHKAYERLAAGPASQVDPVEVHEARARLALADLSFVDDGSSQETRDLAYAAERRIDLAEVRTQTAMAKQRRQIAQAEISQLRKVETQENFDDQARLTSAQLTRARQPLAAQNEGLATAQAAADLKGIASVKHEPRGMVITLSGGVLFAVAKSDLLPEAQARLSYVARVLKKQDKDSKILVQGYTDSEGSESLNLTLSQSRAEAVRDYLISHGITTDRVTAHGFGQATPVADNASAEGRAENRRVEIVVQPTGPGSGG